MVEGELHLIWISATSFTIFSHRHLPDSRICGRWTLRRKVATLQRSESYFPVIVKPITLPMCLLRYSSSKMCGKWLANEWTMRTTLLYRVSQEEWTKLRESVPYVELYRYNPKHLYPNLNGYEDNDHRKVWAFGVYCRPSVTPYSSSAHARQPDTAS